MLFLKKVRGILFSELMKNFYLVCLILFRVRAMVPAIMKKVRFPCLVLTVVDEHCPGWWACELLREIHQIEIQVLDSKGVQVKFMHFFATEI